VSQVIGSLFANYESTKLGVVHPELVNLAILAIFAMLAVATSRRTAAGSSCLLDVVQTEQIKGLAIFFVLLGHVWTHVSATKASINLAHNSVAVFLLLSGFGLTMSNRRQRLSFGAFCLRRIRKVMVPYWIATVIIIALDYALLAKGLSLRSLVTTMVGINLTEELRYIDHVRWFVTFILLWYLLFYLGGTVLTDKQNVVFLLSMAVLLSRVQRHYMDCGWYAFLSFPTGCVLAIYRDKFRSVFRERNMGCLVAAATGILLVLAYQCATGRGTTYTAVTQWLPSPALTCLRECLGVVFAISLIVLFGYLGQQGIEIALLRVLGKYAYEILLLHGVFLIKYNPIMKSTDSCILAAQFTVFCVFIAVLALTLSRVSALVSAEAGARTEVR